MVLCNKHFLGSNTKHVYRIYKSDDCGETFTELCVVPIMWFGRGYGAFTFREDGSLVVNVHNETHLDYAVSYDCGKSFSETGKNRVAKKIRNPQIAFMDGIYVLHGRGGNRNFVFYTSTDGINWDDGYCLGTKRAYCYYSENIVLHAPDGSERMLVHYSDTYSGKRVNVMSVWVTKSKLESA